MAANNVKFENIDKLFENTKECLHDALEILIRFANNIINNPNNPKYRRIRVSNAVVSSKLLPAYGAIECLFDMGFLEDGEYFTLAQDISLDEMIQIRNEMIKRRKATTTGTPNAIAKNDATKSQEVRPKTTGGSNAPTQNSSLAASNYAENVTDESELHDPSQQFTVLHGPIYPSDILRREGEFVRKVVSSSEHVLIYEDSNLQEKARSVIPIVTLKSTAARKLAEIQNVDGAISIHELLLLELLAWFKTTFFKWVNSPKCEHCRGETRNVGMTPATDQERMWGAGRVESYQCNVCQRFTRFPRYNHPGKLLETRRGRCGEWANCFTLCCRAVGFEARYTLDWTDHVWTEVYSESQKRWLHCDPCENTCDKPLVYEHGWGKKLSYVIAFSKDEVQDVTWRYSAKHTEVMLRRIECREEVLLKTIERLCKQRQRLLSEARKNELIMRLVAELVEFWSPKVAKDGETGGRTSGSLAWRLARSETKRMAAQSVVIKPTDDEIKGKALHLKYNCASNQYERPMDKYLVSKDWESLVYEAENIMRKEELDWNMVYLARTEGSTSATISWKFDLSGKSVVIDTIEVICQSKCYEDGQVAWKLCAGDICARIPSGNEKMVISTLSGEDEVTLTAEMERGQGDVAWQHTQLFRQSMDSRHEYPLDIKIHFKTV